MEILVAIADCVLAIMAIIAGLVSWFEYRSHKQKENNKLLSQLNKRYIENQDIQTVVKYTPVRDKNSS